MKILRPSFSFLLLSVSVAMQCDALAAALMFDFGPTTVTNTSPNFDARVSPAHQVGAIPTSEASWNTVLISDIAAGGLFDSTGAALAGVSLNLGIETAADSGIISFATNPTGSTLTGTGGSGGSIGGVYGGTRAARDGTFTGGTQNITLGLRIDGLQAGTYTLYYTSRNTNTILTNLSRAYAAVGASSGTFTFSSVSNTADVSNSNALTATSFQLGTSFNTLNVTVATGESIYMAFHGVGTESRGIINSLQVVAVPEPSTMLLLAIGGLVFCLRRKHSLTREMI